MEATMTPKVEVRPATAADAEVMGLVHVRAWQAAYRGVMPDDYLDGLQVDERAGMWRTRIARAELPPVLVVTIDGVVAGFAAYGRPVSDDEPEGCGQLYAINLDPDHWRRGAGRTLLRAATQALAELAYREAVLWVVPENDRARGLYEAEGWRADGGEVVEDALGATVREIRYRRTLP